MAHLPSTSKTVKFGDNNYETTLWRWFNEDNDDASDVDQVELDCALDCDHDTNSEQSASEAESNEDTDMELDDNQDQERNLGFSDRVENQNRNYYYGKNRYKWSQSTPFKKNSRTPSHNIVVHLPGGNREIERSTFLKNIALSLVKPHMVRRHSNFSIPLKIRLDIEDILGLRAATPPQSDAEILEVRKYCYLCPSKSHRKTKFLCIRCHKPICLQCASNMLQNKGLIGIS
nr:unnamed protein product [Callosobruchus analis]